MADLIIGIAIGFAFGTLLNFVWGFVGAWIKEKNT
jgi:hypothetical protein